MIVRCWDDCEAFLLDWKPDDLKIVIKPLESAGSDSVYLCHSTEEVKEAFSIIDGQVKKRKRVKYALRVSKQEEAFPWSLESAG